MLIVFVAPSLVRAGGGSGAMESSSESEYVSMCGTPLAECRQEDGDEGSWSSSGRCDADLHGHAVHAMCVDLPVDFSEATSQQDWSVNRAGKPHCVCIGAWSMY